MRVGRNRRSTRPLIHSNIAAVQSSIGTSQPSAKPYAVKCSESVRSVAYLVGGLSDWVRAGLAGLITHMVLIHRSCSAEQTRFAA